MAGHLVERSSTGLWFAVDGKRVDLSGWRLYPHRWAGGAFNADYEQLRRLLPSPPLYPVRVSRNRALVCIWGAYIPAAGHEPPFLGFGEVALMAFVTSSEKPAPPLVPGLGPWAMQRYGFGFYPVIMFVSNRLAAELYRILLGIPATVADIRVEQRLDRERFRCEEGGRLVWDLTVRSDGRPSAGGQAAEERFYAAERGEVFRLPVGWSGITRSRYGRDPATVVVGDHGLADRMRSLGLSRSWAAEFSPDRQLWPAGTPERLGSTELDVGARSLPEVTEARLVVSPKPGVEYEVDQGLDSLGWDPAGVFGGPDLLERSALTPDHPPQDE